MILIDTSGLLALHEISNPYRQRVLDLIAIPQVRILSPFILAELDYLINKHAGAREALTFLKDVERGVYALETFGNSDLARASAIIEQHTDPGLGLADASIVVLAERHHCHDVLTLDQRHFRAIRPANGNPFHLPIMDRLQ